MLIAAGNAATPHGSRTGPSGVQSKGTANHSLLEDVLRVIDGVTTIPVPGLPLGALCEASSQPKRPIALGGFVVGPENRLVEPVAAELLDDQPDAGRPPTYNPLYVYGPTGSGKSHLLRGAVAIWKGRRRGPAQYLSADDFARQLTDAYETHAIIEFRAKLRRASLVAIDDVGRLADKLTAQEELAAAIDEIVAAGRRILVSGPGPAPLLSGFSPRLVGRLASGMSLPLALPERATRSALLAELAQLREIALPDGAVELMAERLSGGPRELAGALVQLEAAARLAGEELSLAQVRRWAAVRGKPHSPQIKEIAAATARQFHLRLAELRSASRRQAVVTARGVAMHLARQLTGDSLEQIGKFFGGRDHTTVLHGCRTTQSRLKSDPAVNQAVQAVREALGAAQR